MCGLIIADRNRFTESQVQLALASMSHRGADGLKGVSGTGDWWVGHTRLAIRETGPEGNQPFTLRSGKVRAFVGEFFHVKNETEYFQGVLDEGLQALHGADGFWALCEIGGAYEFAAVDFLGIKSLYYWPEKALVCSEIKPMLAMAGTPKLDELYLSNCIKWGYDYSGRTAFQGIYQIPPGCLLELKDFSPRQYWHWGKVQPCGSLYQGLSTSLNHRLKGQRDIALLLSGGLDSSIIYYLLETLDVRVKAFSFENGESEFLPLGVSTLEETETNLDEALKVMEAPLDLGSLIPQMELAKAVRQEGFNVCLTGDGADELFGGYRRALEYDSQASDIFCELPYYHLPRLDKVMMSQTIELRSPFLAPSVIARALQTPYPQRINKQILKEEFADIVPRKILDRPKKPLKTEAVKTGGLAYRKTLVEEFRKLFRS